MFNFMRSAPDNRTRVLFINSAVLAGADTWVHFLLLRNLPQVQFELHAAGQPGSPSPAFDDLRAIPGITVRPTNFGPSLWQRSNLQKLSSIAEAVPASASLLGLAAYVRHHRIEILHATDRPRDAMACVVLAALTGAKALIHAHVSFGDWMSRGVLWALGRADAIVGVSNYTAETFVKAGYRADRVHAVLNAIDPSQWDPALDPGPGRALLNVPVGAPLIVSVARIFHWKGHSELISALALIKRRYPDVRLAIVGTDYPADSGATRMLKEQARQLGVAENVVFTGQRSDVASLLAACDVFSLPSFEEPFGLVFAEAMAMKRPVVALNNGGTPEVVEHGKCGLLSPPGDIDLLAANLLRLLDDPALRTEFGEYGRSRVVKHFNPQRMASDFAALYSRMLK
ncbi:glycosyltransferase family 4 protein [Bradyrhizobium erythrophlei]|uniref:Glycosyltransferase Family 4 n=1 Tax=Bradyrhizobium erythrophlei TaxID=1437360 RepID=A0A1M7SQ84_9BRAD|nr:glycosyltransferase family 4 protein [Bradyrhizobium erythrophlei]SHN60673.1 Glycosyltransferase Family 4 [Bradyrhizobium erythrophlei]